MATHKIATSEVTPHDLYLSRRKFIMGIGAAAGLMVLAAQGCRKTNAPGNQVEDFCQNATASKSTDELGAALTPCDSVLTYNNFYEFTTDKSGVGDLTGNFKTSPWTVQVGGLVSNPKTFDLDDLRRLFPTEERIYRMRCVEAWSMVIPWLGFPLAKLLNEVVPNSQAKYVRFETLFDPNQMPGQNTDYFPWPYVEGLRLDEAMHDITILATGLYGGPLPPQDGAPVRLVVPWKYGFKSIKSVVKIDLVADMPRTFWSSISPFEYGFYSNVNPDVPHPRWPQSSERRIGELERRPTLIFNGYGDQVAHLYQGMDLHEFF